MHVKRKSLQRPTRWRHPPTELIDVSPGGGLEFQNSGEKKRRKSTKRLARDFWRRYTERRTNCWRGIRRLASDQNTEDAQREKRQQKLALPPRDACRPIKKCPARIPNCLDGRSCFLSVCCDAVNHTTLWQPANWKIQPNSGAVVQPQNCVFFYFSMHLKFPVLPPKSGTQLGNGSATSSLLSVTWQLHEMDYC